MSVRLFAGLMAMATTALMCPAADLTTYRGFTFGSSVEVAAKLVSLNPAEVVTLYKRPALIQELTWRPGYSYSAIPVNNGPVREVLLRFCNGKLFQMQSTYDRQAVEGLTGADMVELISRTYGPATDPKTEIPFHSNYGETAKVIAQWSSPDGEYVWSLVPTGDRGSYVLVLTATSADKAARAAIAEAVVLDATDAPRRATELRNKLEDEARALRDDARTRNLPTFKP